jgi:hypothetical protein
MRQTRHLATKIAFMRIAVALFVLVWCGFVPSASAQQNPQAAAPDVKGASSPGVGAQAKTTPQPAKPSVPDDLKLIILIRTSLIALNPANLTGNYSVLRDMAAPGFQQANNAAQLAQIFSDLRNRFDPSANTSVFAKLDVTFGDNVDGVGGKAGMRVSW